MTGRTNQISIYVTDERKAELEQRADAQDDSLSGVINELIDRQLQQEAQEAIASETRAEERLQELITLGVEEMAETAEEIRDMNAKVGAYAIANFELLKQNRTNHDRREALTTGMHRVRQDLDAVEELDGDGDGSDADPTATDRGATTDPDVVAEPRSDPDPATGQAGDPDGDADEDTGTDADADAGTDADDAGDTDTDIEDGDLFERLRSGRE